MYLWDCISHTNSTVSPAWLSSNFGWRMKREGPWMDWWGMDDEFLAVFTWHCCTFFLSSFTGGVRIKVSRNYWENEIVTVFFYSSQDEGLGGARMSFTKKKQKQKRRLTKLGWTPLRREKGCRAEWESFFCSFAFFLASVISLLSTKAEEKEQRQKKI